MTSGRVLELFDQLCDAPLHVVERALAQEPTEVSTRVWRMLAADRAELTPLGGEEVAVAIAEDIAVDMTPVEPWSPPSVLPGLVLGTELGRGGMGVVVAAVQEDPRRDVAVKFLDPSVTEIVEAHMLAKLRHPAIPVVYLVGEQQGGRYLVMERVHGRSLLGWCQEHAETEILTLFVGICRAVEHAHAAGVLHRDLKPSNLLCERDAPWVLDFGLANDEDAIVRGVIGTPAYIEDEVLAGQPATRQSDVFSLGVVLAEMLGGQRPTRGSRGGIRRQRVQRQENPPHLWSDHADPGLRSIVQTCLRPRAQRYHSAEELAQDVIRHLEGRAPTALDAGWGMRLQLFARRNVNGIGFGLGAAAVVGLFMTLAARPFLEGWRAEQRASEFALEVRERVDRLTAEGDPVAASEALQSALSEPILRGSQASARERLHHGAALMEARDFGEATRWLARAYVDAEGELRGQVALVLARTLEARRAWYGLHALLQSIPEEHRGPFEIQAALGRRDVFDPSVPPAWHFLREGRALPYRPLVLAVSSPHSVIQLVEHDEKRVVELSTDLETLHRTPVPAAWLGQRKPVPVLRANGDILWVFTKAGDGGIVVARLVEGGWEVLGERADTSGVLSAAVVAAPSERLLLGTGPPHRQLLAFDPDSGVFSAPSDEVDALDSDVNALVALPDPERLVMLQGAWQAYDLQMFDTKEAQLERTERVRIGGTAIGGLLPRKDQDPLLALWKADEWSNAELLGSDHPFGIPPGLYLLDPARGFEVQHHRENVDNMSADRVVVGDFDGDGWHDLVVRGPSSLFLRMGPDGVVDSQWMIGFVPLAAADLDGDGDDELLGRLADQDHRMWVFGLGDARVPMADREVQRPDLEIGGRAGLLVEMGLFAEALDALVLRAEMAGNPEAARRWWRAASEVAQLPETGRPEVADRALRALVELDPANEPLLRKHQLDRHRMPDDKEVLLSFAEDELPLMEVMHPAALRRDRSGLTVRGAGADGLIFRVPVRVTGDHIALELDFVLLEVERGAQLEVMLVDAMGAPVLGVGVLPYGGGRSLARSSRCTFGDVFLGDFPDLEPNIRRSEHQRLRASRVGGDVLCAITRDGVLEQELTRHWPQHTQGMPVALEVRLTHAEGHEMQYLEARLQSIRLVGLEATPVTRSPAFDWVSGRPGALVRLQAHPSAPLLAARLGDIGPALNRDVPPHLWLGEMRRYPHLWITVFATDPPRLARMYAAAWAEPTRSGSLQTANEALDHPLIDGLPDVDQNTHALMFNRGRLLLDQGQADRAVAVFQRLYDAQNAGPGMLVYASALLRAGHPERAAAVCRAGIAGHESSHALDPLAHDEALWKVCGSPPLARFLTPLRGSPD